MIIKATPEGDNGILANPVRSWKGYIFDIVRSNFRGIYEMKRGFTEVRFDDHLNLSSFESKHKNVEIGSKIPGRDCQGCQGHPGKEF